MEKLICFVAFYIAMCVIFGIIELLCKIFIYLYEYNENKKFKQSILKYKKGASKNEH